MIKAWRKYCLEFFKDVISVIKKHDAWLYIAWIDIKLRYKRTALGPFWMVIVSFISIFCIAGLGSLLFSIKLADYFPYVACGMVTWSLISTLITESCMLYINQQWLIKNIKTHLLNFCFRLFVKNLIIFAHALVVIICVLLFLGAGFSTAMLLLPLTVLIYMINAVSISVCLGFFATRFRDVVQIVQALINILAFMTPIMCKPKMLKEYAYLADFNPLTHYVAIFREPLLGVYPSSLTWSYVIIFTLINLFLTIMVYGKYKKQLVFWL